MSLGVTFAVWTVGAIEWTTGATPHDDIAYAGSLAIAGVLLLLALQPTRLLDREAMGALRPAGPAVAEETA